MAKKKVQKTNAMRYLDRCKVDYEVHTYEHKESDPVDGIHVCQMLGQDPKNVFKTLVTQANTKEFVVFMLPVAEELDLKKMRKSSGCQACGNDPCERYH